MHQNIMNEKPIIFNAEMVRAVLDGRKTQTRRVIKMDKYNPNDCQLVGLKDGIVVFTNPRMSTDIGRACPYGKPGDRLWVRETFTVGTHMGELMQVPKSNAADIIRSYKADFKEGAPALTQLRWRPSIHMPRWASRINLEITGIRVERVQDIKDNDAGCEGCRLTMMSPDPNDNGSYLPAFEYLWDSINEKRGYGWDVNPWVWIVEFKRID